MIDTATLVGFWNSASFLEVFNNPRLAKGDANPGSLSYTGKLVGSPAIVGVLPMMRQLQAGRLAEMNSNADQLRQSAVALQPSKNRNLWRAMTVSSTVSGSTTGIAREGDFPVSITQVAKAQRDLGTALTGTSRTSPEPDQALPDKMSMAINGADAGVTARVNEDARTVSTTGDKSVDQALVNEASATAGDEGNTLIAGINDFLSAYNNMLIFLAQNQDLVSPQFSSRLHQVYLAQSMTLEAAGITAGAQGILITDQAALTNAVANNRAEVQRALAGPGGLAETAGDLAEEIASSPLTAISSSLQSLNSHQIVYNNLGLLSYLSSSSPWASSGTLFNQLA